MTRVALSGTHIVRTLDALEARVLDLSLRGERVAPFGILRPDFLRLVKLPAALDDLRLSAQILWCTIRGAEWQSEG